MVGAMLILSNLNSHTHVCIAAAVFDATHLTPSLDS